MKCDVGTKGLGLHALGAKRRHLTQSRAGGRQISGRKPWLSLDEEGTVWNTVCKRSRHWHWKGRGRKEEGNALLKAKELVTPFFAFLAYTCTCTHTHTHREADTSLMAYLCSAYKRQRVKNKPFILHFGWIVCVWIFCIIADRNLVINPTKYTFNFFFSLESKWD